MCLAADLSLHLLTRPVFLRVVTSYFTFKTVKQNLVVAAHHESESRSRAEAKQAELMSGKKAEAEYFLSQ